MERVRQETLVTDAAVAEWKRYKQYGTTVDQLFDSSSTNGKATSSASAKNGHGNGHDTVGCVALDIHGNIACATSTGGITAKKVGRVGDSPLIGSGGYADNSIGGVSTTGHGESIGKVVLAHRILNLAQTSGCSIQEAAEVRVATQLDITTATHSVFEAVNCQLQT